MVRVWLWKPQMKVQSPVLKKHYRCCCSCCNSVFGFKAFNYVSAILLLICWPVYFLGAANVEGQQWWSMVLTTGVTLLGLAAIRTMRPFYMQLYAIYAGISITMHIALFSFLLFATSFGYVAYQDPEVAAQIREQLTGLDVIEKQRLGEYMLLSIIFFICTLLILVWQIQLTFSFYFYVRDRQLEIEAQALTVTVRGPLTLVNRSEKDLEKQHPDFLPLNPPAYEV